KHGMPAHRMGRLWKFKKDEVDGWVKAGGASDKPDTAQ
ncbi:MAG TPA: transcriptional regulator, partial [Candidatus Acetothermia bacterium]|nr:transcriptional regulator [Candidatus Acetothermia bacterium]